MSYESRNPDNLVDLFASRVTEGRNDIAVTFQGVDISYGQLDGLSRRVARFLGSRGVHTEEPVGILMDRGIDVVAAVVGIVKSGCAYVPLDTGSPAARLRMIVDECGIGRVVVDTAARADEVRAFCGDTVDVVVFHDIPDRGGEPDTEGARAEAVAAPSQLAYVIYTSGSTGAPKGVAVARRDLVTFASDPCWSNGLDERVLQHSPLNFDASVFEMWMPLLRGGCVVVAPPGSTDAGALGRLIAAEDVSCAFVTTSLFNVLVEEYPDGFAGIRQIWVGGEAAHQRILEAGQWDLDLQVTEGGTGDLEELLTQAARVPFDLQVEHGEDVAVIDGEVRLSYRELDIRSGVLTQYLAARGTDNESCVALLLDRGADAVTAFVRVVKAGAAYVPFDPHFPTSRMVAMAKERRMQTVLVDTAERADLVRGFVDQDTEPAQPPCRYGIVPPPRRKKRAH